MKGNFMANTQKPGETPNRPGEYIERGPRGGIVDNPRQVTIEKGDPKLPPTQEPGRKWERISPPRK
jgi:YjzC-like protein